MAKLTFTINVELADGSVKSWSETSDAERRQIIENAGKRGSAALSDYYRQHPEQFAKL